MNRQRDLEENYEAEFAARLTAVSSASGAARYTWHEVEPGFFGVYTDLSNGRSGDDVTNYMVEMNNQTVALPLVVRARLRGADEQTQVFEFEAPQGAAGGGGGSLTVQNKDGTQLGTASSLVLDQSTGLRVLSITGGAANLQNDAATVSGAGVVTTQAQTMTGDKSFQGTYNLPSLPQGGTDTVLIGGSGTRMGASGGYGPYIRLRMQITSGSGAGGDSNMYLAPTQVILAAPPLALDGNNNITALSGPGVSSSYGGVSLLPSFADSVPRRATVRYTSPNLDFVLDTAGVGQAARFVINDNAGSHPGASATTGGLTFVGGLYVSGTATGGGVPTGRLINTTAPLAGGGDLSADRTLSVLAQNSVTAAAAGLQLVNDAAAPGNSVYYGTDKTGARGYYALPVDTKSAVWRYSTNTTMADPSAGNYRINTGLFTSATTLAISSTTDAGTDVSNTLKALAAGDTLQIQDQSVAANWVRYKITSAVNNTTWFQFGVSYVAGGGAAVSNNTPCLVTVTLAGGGTGGAMTIQDEGVTLSTTATALNFTGLGVTASGSGASITVNVPGGGGGSGTVTSVDVSGGSTGLTTSGGPVTASGTITIAGTLAVASGGTGSTSAAAALTALGAAPSSRTISTTAPLAGGGDLTANRTLTVSTFSSSASGVVPSSGGGTTNFLRADGTWAAAGVPTARAINTTAPLAGGGDLSADRTLSITNFTSSAAGAVPASGGGTSAFLRADGSWAAPPSGGGFTISVQSASFTAGTTPTSYYCSSASGAITATLPPAAGNSGLRLAFKKTSATSGTNVVTVKGNASENINAVEGSANTLVLYHQGDAVTLECDGAAWWTVSDHRRAHVCVATGSTSSFGAGAFYGTLLNTAVIDEVAILDAANNRLVLRRAGRYLALARLPYGISATNVQIQAQKNGVEALRHTMTNAAAASTMGVQAAGVLAAAAGDALNVAFYHNGGTSQTFTFELHVHEVR